MLVNNAGVYRFLSLEETTEDEFHREFNINVLGTILATKEAINTLGRMLLSGAAHVLAHVRRDHAFLLK